jgi:hypothetical protein
VEPRRFEPLTSALQTRNVPNLYLRRWDETPPELRNNICCNSLGLPWFVPERAQNVPTVRSFAQPLGHVLEFEERGAHKLKGVPGEWRLFAVTSP